VGKFRILPSLPPYGPLPVQFSATKSGMHKEGLAVEFYPDSATPWVGNFQRGVSQFDRVLDHPDEMLVVVIAGGQGYIVDPSTRSQLASLGVDIDCVFDIPSPKQLIIGNGLWFESHSEYGRQWKTPRISWDGMRSVTLAGDELRGEAWTPLGERWVPFSLNIRSGRVVGGTSAEQGDGLAG
jgi:hypothetical protein